jgi:hypothetical protein
MTTEQEKNVAILKTGYQQYPAASRVDSGRYTVRTDLWIEGLALPKEIEKRLLVLESTGESFYHIATVLSDYYQSQA